MILNESMCRKSTGNKYAEKNEATITLNQLRLQAWSRKFPAERLRISENLQNFEYPSRASGWFQREKEDVWKILR